MTSETSTFSVGTDVTDTDDGSAPPGTSGWSMALIKTLMEVIIGALGIITNGIVIFVLMRTPALKKHTTNLYIINQSLIDMVVSFILLLITQVDSDIPKNLTGLGGSVLCFLWVTRMLLWGPMLASNYNLVVMTLERYISIARPIWHKNHVTKTRVRMSLAIPWVFGLAYEGTVKFATTKFTNGICLLFQFPNMGSGRAVGIMYVIVQYIIPLAVFSFCYGHMVTYLRLRVRPIEQTSGENKGQGKRYNPMERARRNVIKTMFVIALGFILCWTINEIYFLLYNLGFNVDFASILYHASALLVFVNCTINPFIYAFKYEQYQKALLAILGRAPKVGIWFHTADSSSTASRAMNLETTRTRDGGQEQGNP